MGTDGILQIDLTPASANTLPEYARRSLRHAPVSTHLPSIQTTLIVQVLLSRIQRGIGVGGWDLAHRDNAWSYQGGVSDIYESAVLDRL